MDLNPQAKSSDAGSSDTTNNNKLMVPISVSISVPSSIPISDQPSDGQRIGAGEKSDHTISIPEPHFCRICFEGEEEDGNVDDLIELRCSCKGHMSMMHRNCILMWYGLRMILNKCFTCELCNTVLHPATQLVVEQAVGDHENQGRDILLKALASRLPPHPPHVDLESAATYHELVELIHKRKLLRYMSRQIFVDTRGRRHSSVRVAVIVVLGAAAVAGALYLIVALILYRKDEFDAGRGLLCLNPKP